MRRLDDQPIAETSAAPRRRPLVLTGIMLGMFMSAVESTIVASAMPTIVAQLGGFELFSWVFAIYLLALSYSGEAPTDIWGQIALWTRLPVESVLVQLVPFVLGSAMFSSVLVRDRQIDL